MKKIISIIIINVLIIFSLSLNSYAAQTETNFQIELISNKTTVTKGDTVEISVKIKNLTGVGEGINAFLGTFKYDTNVFEKVTKSDMKSQNGWDAPEYNEENGKIITCKGEYITNDEIIFTIDLKVKENTSVKNTTLQIDEPEAANDNDYVGKAGTLNLEILEKTDTEKPDEENPDTEKPDEENPDTEKPNEENPDTEKPDEENPDTEKPDEENPDTEKPDEENPDTEKPSTNSNSNNNQNNNSNSGKNENTNIDNTTAGQKIPQTGEKLSFTIVGLIVLITIGIISYILYRKNNIAK